MRFRHSESNRKTVPVKVAGSVFILILFAAPAVPRPGGLQEPRHIEWSLSKRAFEEDGSAKLEIRLDRPSNETVSITPKWVVVESPELPIDPSRIDMPPLTIEPGVRQLSVEVRLPRDQITQVDTEVLLTLESETSDLEFLPQQHRIKLLDVAADSVLWIGMEKVFLQDSAFQALAEHRRILFPWLEFDPWVMPEVLTWTEDPFGDNAWQVLFQSLGWAMGYGRGYDLTGDPEYLEKLASVVFDYLEANPFPGLSTEPPILESVDSDTPERSKWSSLAVAKRTETLAYVYRRYISDRLDKEQKRRLMDYLLDHGEVLRDFLDSDLSFQHNHGFSAARALLKLTHAFPEMTAGTDWRTRSSSRLHEYVVEMTDPTSGVSTEQSMYYHYYAIELFSKIETLLSRLGEPMDYDLPAHLEKMAEYAAVTMYPDGTAPAYGDTKNGIDVQKWLGRLYAQAARSNDVVDFVLSRSEIGSSPPAISQYPNQGYVVLRPERSFPEPDDWRNQPVIFIDFGDPPQVHGHHDAMSFLAYFEGEAALVDVSGPYNYMPDVRPFIVARSRGNAFIVDGYEHVDSSARLCRVYEWPGVTAATGKLTQQGVTLSRTVAWLDSRALVVIDQASPDDDGPHRYSLFHHFPPASEVTTDGGRFRIQTDKGLNVQQWTFASAKMQAQVHVSLVDDAPLTSEGWAVTGFREAVPAPVTEVSMTSDGPAWMVTVIAPKAGDGWDAVNVVESGSEILMSIGNQSVRYSLQDAELIEE